jgi:hypothetical protein
MELQYNLRKHWTYGFDYITVLKLYLAFLFLVRLFVLYCIVDLFDHAHLT